MLKYLYTVFLQLREAFRLLVKNDPLRLAGATAFFTTFALPPILLILIQLLSLIFNRRSISQQLFLQLGSVVGKDSVHQLIDILKAFRGLAGNWAINIIGFLFLIFVATTLFKVIQSSLNQLWMIRTTGKKNFRMAMRGRAKSILIIVFTGLLFIASLITDSLASFFGRHLEELLPVISFYLNNTISTLVSITVVWMWFTALLRYLPDGRPSWRIAFTGGLLTSILFNIGKMILKWLLPNSNIGVVYGTSASIVLLLLFVFYSSLIFYYGAAFTKVWSVFKKQPILPNYYAGFYDYADITRPESTSSKSAPQEK